MRTPGASINPRSNKMANNVLFTTDKKQPTGLHFTLNHTGKMAGLQSLSTACTVNPQCQKNAARPGSICSHCFSFAMMKRYSKDFERAFVRNYEILNNGILDPEQLPKTNCAFFRIESFGDLGSMVQAINYINFIAKNPQTKFAWWTKNPKFIAQAIDAGYSIPENVQIIFSSIFLNATAYPKKYDFINKVFTVYDKQTAKGIDINCGSRSCFTCNRCYRKNPDGVKVEMIREILK